MCPSKFKELWKKKIWPYFMSLSHIWQRVLNASIFWRSSYIAYPFPFFKFFSTPLHPCCLQSIPSLVILLSCLFCWMGDHSIFDVLLYLTISWTYTCRALGPWCMFYASRLLLLSDACGFLLVDLISHAYKCRSAKRHILHSGASGLIHPYKYIFVPTLCAHSSYLYYIEWIIH